MDHRAAKAYILLKLRRELPARRTYHCLEHTLDVYASAIDIAAQEGVVGEDLSLLKVAALYHDSGFTEGDGEHERLGCAIAQRTLPRFGFSERQVGQVCELIMATHVPHRPAEGLARILCDADLDYLGRPDFHRIGATLLAEHRACGRTVTQVEWNRMQVRFMEEHRYFTATNLRDRAPMKAEHLGALRRWLQEHDRP